MNITNNGVSTMLYTETVDPRWDITSPSIVDDSTIKDQYVNRLDTSGGTTFATYIPSTSLITFRLENTNDYYDLSRAYLKVKVALVTGNGNAIGANDIAALSNNIVGSIISHARIVISNHEVESVNHVDVASLINLLNMTSCEEYKSLKDMLFFYSGEEGDERSLAFNSATDNCTIQYILDNGTDIIKNPEYNGNFTARYNRTKLVNGVSPTVTINFPLKYIFNFCKDLNKLLYKSDVDIHFTLTNDWNKCVDVVNDVSNDGGFRPFIKSMCLRLPAMEPSDAVRAELMAMYIAEETFRPIFTRSQLDKYTSHTSGTNRVEWRIGSFSGSLHGIYFVFKKKADENQPNVVHQVFDNAGVSIFSVRVGNTKYPAEDINIDFGNLSGIIDYADAYNEYLRATKKLINRRDEQALVTYSKYPTVYPIYYLDLSKHRRTDSSTSEEVTLTVNLDSSTAYNIYALVEQEQMLLMSLRNTPQQRITVGPS